MMTASMIYPQQTVANMIAGKLSKSKGVKYVVRKVTTGFQVVDETLFEQQKTASIKAMVAEVLKKTTPASNVVAVKTWAQGDAVSVTLKFRGESTAYVDAWLDGKPVSFGKGNLISWEKQGDDVLLKMTKAFAKKRGLI
jgi:hypothetical protein